MKLYLKASLLLIGLAASVVMSASMRQSNAIHGLTTAQTFISSDDDSNDGYQSMKNVPWKERVKSSDTRKSMRWWSLFGLLISGGVVAFLWKESDKRNERYDLYVLYGGALLIFLDCLLFFNFLRWLFPVWLVMALIYPLFYLNRSKGLMITIMIIGGLILTCMCFSYGEIMSELSFLGGLGCWLLNAFIFLVFGYIHIPRICPHCHYFAGHQKTGTTFDGEDTSIESTSYTTDTGGHSTDDWAIGKIHYKHTKTDTTTTTYLNKHYTDTYECMRCGKPFSLKRTEREEIDSKSDTTYGRKMIG